MAHTAQKYIQHFDKQHLQMSGYLNKIVLHTLRITKKEL